METKNEKIAITKDMTFSEVIQAKPEAVERLSQLGLGCVGCAFSQFDTLENGANIHGISVDEILEELND